MRTPTPKRILRGPRGAVTRDATPCADCVALDCCRPGPINQPFGCDSWADAAGRGVDLEADFADLAARAEARPDMTDADLASVLGTLEDGPAVELTPAEAADLAGAIPEGLTPEEWAGMSPAERETAEGLDALARLPDPEEDAATLAAIDALESRFEPDDPGPLFRT